MCTTVCAMPMASLTCHQQNSNFGCPGSMATCHCNATIRLEWKLIPGCNIQYDIDNRPVGNITSLCEGPTQTRNVYSVVLDTVTSNSYSSTLNITLEESVMVTCDDTFGPKNTTITIASK